MKIHILKKLNLVVEKHEHKINKYSHYQDTVQQLQVLVIYLSYFTE